MTLAHVTLLSGRSVSRRVGTLDPAVVEACRALLPGGGPVPGFPAYMIDIASPLFTVWRRSESIVTCGIGTGHDGLWDRLVELQTLVAPVSVQPPRGRWLAIVLLPGLLSTARDDIGWLDDFLLCVAAALLL